MEMSDGEDHNDIFFQDVDHSIGKPSDQTSSRVLLKRLPRLRELPDPIDREKHLPNKLIAKPRSLTVVVVDRIVKFGLGNVKESDVHFDRYSARISSAEIVAATPNL